MTLLEIVEAAKLENPNAFGKVNDKRSIAIVRAVLNELGKQVKETEEGPVAVAKFGKFIVRRVKVQKDGKENVQRRVIFRAANPKQLEK